MRPGLEISAYLGEVNVKMADAVIITGYWHRGEYGMVAIATFLPSVAATR
jgi:predicted GTPase